MIAPELLGFLAGPGYLGVDRLGREHPQAPLDPMLNPSGVVPRHLILHLQNKDGESQHADIAQSLFGQALTM